MIYNHFNCVPTYLSILLALEDPRKVGMKPSYWSQDQNTNILRIIWTFNRGANSITYLIKLRTGGPYEPKFFRIYKGKQELIGYDQWVQELTAEKESRKWYCNYENEDQLKELLRSLVPF